MVQKVKSILFGSCCLVIGYSSTVFIAFYFLGFGGIPVAGEQSCKEEIKFIIFWIGR